jgi:hypothetical protein
LALAFAESAAAIAFATLVKSVTSGRRGQDPTRRGHDPERCAHDPRMRAYSSRRRRHGQGS